RTWYLRCIGQYRTIRPELNCDNIPVKFWGGVDRNRVSEWKCRTERDDFVCGAIGCWQTAPLRLQDRHGTHCRPKKANKQRTLVQSPCFRQPCSLTGDSASFRESASNSP